MRRLPVGLSVLTLEERATPSVMIQPAEAAVVAPMTPAPSVTVRTDLFCGGGSATTEPSEWEQAITARQPALTETVAVPAEQPVEDTTEAEAAVYVDEVWLLPAE